MFYKVTTEVITLHEYVIEAKDGEEAYEVFGEATARIPSLDPNQSCHEPECVMSITPCDENGMDLP
jgi:hypothetical protein